ncbi:lasso peptide biosynthesis B2 protein [Corynebacterium cystitidis]
MFIPRFDFKSHYTSIPAVLLARLLALLPPKFLEVLMRMLSAGTGEIGNKDLEEIHSKVTSCAPRLAGWRGCLPRSIAICLIARGKGCWPDRWAAGARFEAPFAAHAWVENRGEVIAENCGYSAYVPLLTADRGR